VGGLLATVFASYMLSKYGWRGSFLGPGIVLLIMGLITGFFLPQKNLENTSKKAFIGKLLKKPEIWSLGFAYFGLKLIRYSLLFWLPFYLHHELRYTESSSAFISLALEIGGIAGAILVGILADRFTTDRKAIVTPLILTLALSLFFYQSVGHLGPVINFIGLSLVGFFLFGPDTLISGACAQDIGEEELSASAAGFINGFGSIGGILQGFATVYISEHFGWHAIFYFFIVISILASLATMPKITSKTLTIPVIK